MEYPSEWNKKKSVCRIARMVILGILIITIIAALPGTTEATAYPLTSIDFTGVFWACPQGIGDGRAIGADNGCPNLEDRYDSLLAGRDFPTDEASLSFIARKGEVGGLPDSGLTAGVYHPLEYPPDLRVDGFSMAIDAPDEGDKLSLGVNGADQILGDVERALNSGKAKEIEFPADFFSPGQKINQSWETIRSHYHGAPNEFLPGRGNWISVVSARENQIFFDNVGNFRPNPPDGYDQRGKEKEERILFLGGKFNFFDVPSLGYWGTYGTNSDFYNLLKFFASLFLLFLYLIIKFKGAGRSERKLRHHRSASSIQRIP